MAEPTSTPPGFADARACKDWLNALPLGNIPQAQTHVLEAVRFVNGGGMGGIERLKCLELLRDKIAFLQGEQRARYFGKTLPLSANDSNAWTTGRTLLEEMEHGYRECLTAAAAGGELAAHASLIAQRAMRYIGAQMLFHAIIYRRFDPALWTRLHQQYAAAESAGHAQDRVKDSLESDDGSSSVTEAYAQVVLMQAAFLSEITAPKMDFVEALLRLWVKKLRVLSAPPEGSTAKGDPLVVDLDKPIGARPLLRSELQPSHRIIDTAALSLSIRRRIHGLQNEEDPVTLGLPAQVSGVHALTELARLHKLWCEGAPPRAAPKPSTQEKAGLVFGIGEIAFFVTGGKVFEQPDKKRELTSQEKQDIEVFGRVTERTQSKMKAEHNYTLESWTVVDEMLGAVRVLRPATTSRGVSIGRLAGIRLGDGTPFYLGMVSELVQETDGRIIVTIAMLPGKPEPFPVRASDARNRANAQWVQGFRLPALERIKVPASLVVPSGMGLRGRGIDLWDQGAPKEVTVEDVIERGTDFDRVSIF